MTDRNCQQSCAVPSPSFGILSNSANHNQPTPAAISSSRAPTRQKQVRHIVHLQEKQGNFYRSFSFNLTARDFWEGVRDRAVPGITAIGGSFGYGDVLMTTPSLAALKELLPANPVHLYCGPNEYRAFENSPFIDLLIAVPQAFHLGSIPRTYKRICSFYDRGITLCGVINGNPQAELRNAYEVIADRIGVWPRSFVPEYIPLRSEIDRARVASLEAGISIGKDKIVVFQPRSSSLLRTLPLQCMKEVLRLLAERGWTTIVFWESSSVPDISCAGVYWTGRDFAQLALRDLFALVSFANVVISTDSVLSHLAAALNIPSVLLYGPFPWELRAAHFPRALPLQAEVGCGPCYQHGSRCSIEGRQIPSCMDSFDPNRIIQAVNTVIGPDYRLHSPGWNPALQALRDARACDVCACGELREYARKGACQFVQCLRCRSVQKLQRPTCEALFSSPAHQYLDLVESPEERSLAAKSLARYLPTIRSLIGSGASTPLLLEYGAGRGRAYRMLKQVGLDVESFDPLEIPECRPIRRGVWHTDVNRVCDGRSKLYDAVAMLHSLHYVSSIDCTLTHLRQCMQPHGVVILTLFSESMHPTLSPVFNSRCSDNLPIVVPTVSGLDNLMNRYGLQRIWNSRIKYQPSSVFVYRARPS